MYTRQVLMAIDCVSGPSLTDGKMEYSPHHLSAEVEEEDKEGEDDLALRRGL